MGLLGKTPKVSRGILTTSQSKEDQRQELGLGKPLPQGGNTEGRGERGF